MPRPPRSGGYPNRALPPGKIGPFVEAYAQRVAACPPETVRLAKEAVAASTLSLEQGLLEENSRFQRLMASPEAPANIHLFLTIGGETREGSCVSRSFAAMSSASQRSQRTRDSRLLARPGAASEVTGGGTTRVRSTHSSVTSGCLDSTNGSWPATTVVSGRAAISRRAE